MSCMFYQHGEKKSEVWITNKDTTFPTLYVERVVDDKVSIPYHREVNWQVTDITALIVILQQKNRQKA